MTIFALSHRINNVFFYKWWFGCHFRSLRKKHSNIQRVRYTTPFLLSKARLYSLLILVTLCYFRFLFSLQWVYGVWYSTLPFFCSKCIFDDGCDIIILISKCYHNYDTLIIVLFEYSPNWTRMKELQVSTKVNAKLTTIVLESRL